MTSTLPEQVFVVGMNGSGTTMLLDHLSSHSMLFGYSRETRFLPYFLTHESEYGDLADDRNFLRLWHDMKELVVGRVGSGPDRIPTPDDWRDQPRNAASVFDQILRLFAATERKRIWCEKTPMHVNHLRLLGDSFPNGRFIHIVRDGRDCAASFHRRWKFNPVRTVYRWKKVVKAGRAQGKLLGSRYCEVRYEEVTQAPEVALRNICAFLGVPFEESVLRAARSRPEMTGSTAIHVARNTRRAAEYFKPATMARMERVAGKFLTELGYVCGDPTGDRDPARWLIKWWELGDNRRRLWELLFEKGRVFKPRTWTYILKRARGAMKQKETLRL